MIPGPDDPSRPCVCPPGLKHRKSTSLRSQQNTNPLPPCQTLSVFSHSTIAKNRRHTDRSRDTARRGSTESASGWASALRVRPCLCSMFCLPLLNHRKESQRHTDSLRDTARPGSTGPASGWASALRVSTCLCSMFCVLSLDHREDSQTHRSLTRDRSPGFH
jgi:hypothetical protein